MNRSIRVLALAAVSALAISTPALAQSTVVDQAPVPIPGTGNTVPGQSEWLLQKFTDGGITCYQSFYRAPGLTSADSQGGGQFNPGGLSCPTGANNFTAITGAVTPFPISGLAAAQGGTIQVIGGTSSTSANAGGPVQVTGGTPGATGVGGAVTIAGGVGGSTSGTGGAVSLTGGAGTTAPAAGGNASLVGGAGLGTSAGGQAIVTGGASSGGATGNGGAVVITGGATTNTNATGGAASVTGGAGNGSGAGGASGLVGGVGGATGNGGAVTMTGGTGGATSGTGGALTLASGAAGATTGVGGAVSITAGASTNGAGANVTITAAAGATGTNNGGNVNLVPGAAVSTGTPGYIQVNGNAGLICHDATISSGTASFTIFIATRPMVVQQVSAIWSAAAGGTSTAGVFKDTGTNAPGGGTDILSADFNLNTTANTTNTGSLTATIATVTMAAGDRLSVKMNNAIQSTTGLNFTFCAAPT